MLFLFAIFFLVFAYTHFSVHIDSSSGKLLQYTGSYEINKVQRNRNTNYIFTLENGHSIVVKPELLHKRVDELPSQLHSSYSSQKECIFFAYTAIEIASSEEVFLHKDDSISEAKMGAIIGVLMTGLTLSLAIPALSAFLKSTRNN